MSAARSVAKLALGDLGVRGAWVRFRVGQGCCCPVERTVEKRGWRVGDAGTVTAVCLPQLVVGQPLVPRGGGC